MKLTVERLREVVSYNQETGVFLSRVRRGRIVVGSCIGCPTSKGYHRIMIDRVEYLAHRLAWLYVHGVWPDGDIDHIDENKSNNRITNLRNVPHIQNMHNQCRPNRDNRTGYRGISPQPGGRFQAMIQIDGVRKSLGTYSTAEEAHAVYSLARKEASKLVACP